MNNECVNESFIAVKCYEIVAGTVTIARQDPAWSVLPIGVTVNQIRSDIVS